MIVGVNTGGPSLVSQGTTQERSLYITIYVSGQRRPSEKTFSDIKSLLPL